MLQSRQKKPAETPRDSLALLVKLPKRQKRVEAYTVFILRCDGKYALEMRGEQGLLGGLWQFPNVPGKLELPDAMLALDKMGLKVRDILRQGERKHIFTHIRWEMRAYWAEVSAETDGHIWLTPEEINETAALPTAFRQFWEETE